MTLAGTVIVAVTFVRGSLSMPDLTGRPARIDGPLVSVIFAARDEGPNIEAALTSLLAQTYRRLEFIVVNGRSVDDTGTVLDRMARTDSRIRVVHITDLPAKWLGKNHALHVGADQAKGEYILFTDADIIFERDAVARTVSFVEDEKI